MCIAMESQMDVSGMEDQMGAKQTKIAKNFQPKVENTQTVEKSTVPNLQQDGQLMLVNAVSSLEMSTSCHL